MPWPIAPAEACLVAVGVAPVLPLYVHPITARHVTASYEIRLRGGPAFVFRFVDGQLSVEPVSAEPVDCRVSADPVAAVLLCTAESASGR